MNPGTRLGTYQIVSSIGAGGMGEVYRARDTRLNRDVAIKVLPEVFASDPDRLARFEREAQTLASLNHPNIAQIYGVEERALVMELVDGDDLAQRISRGALPVEEAIAIARQIADALEAAHERGIVHRDLKPANVKVTPDGTVKVLDFGLAKALDPVAVSDVSPALSPTFTSPALTHLGVILGTAAYMAPEQARGRPVDRRADIWAFGAVLYEMLAGTQVFAGDTVSDSLALVLTRDPDWTRLPVSTPVAVVTLIRRCLERDPRNRLQAIGEARIVLSNPAMLRTEVRPQTSRLGYAAAFVFVAMGAAAAGFFFRGLSAGEAAAGGALRKLEIAVPDFHLSIDSPPLIAPNGGWILYNDGTQLWTRSLSEFAARRVTGSTGGRYAFWAPDSKEVAFVRDGKLWRAPTEGGDATLIGPVPGDLSGSGAGVWLDRGEILLAGSDTAGLFSISANGGNGHEALKLSHPEESDFHEVTALPDGKSVLFTVHGPAGADKIDVYSNGVRKTVLHIAGENLRLPSYAPPGYLLYSRIRTSPGVWAVRFSLEHLQTEGEPVLIAANASYASAGADGTLAMVRPSDLPSEIVSVDRTGRFQTLGRLQGQYFNAAGWAGMSLSPDGRRLAVGMLDPAGSELWSYEPARGTMTRLSVGGQVALNPTWTPDGSRVFFAAFFGHRVSNVFAVPSAEPGKAERIMAAADASQWPCAISPDGRVLVYAQATAANSDLWVASLDGGGTRPLMQTPFNETDAAFSPDGRAIAYTSDESGRLEIYVRAFPIDSQRVQVSNGGAGRPIWSADGRELFYRTGSGIDAVRISSTPARVEASAPRQVVAVGSDPTLSSSFAVTPDGQQFLFARSSGADRISIILNWTTQLRH